MRTSTRDLPIHDRRDDIQGLRAVAVVLVVAYHLWPEAVPGGFVGVDVFFVISGFLITRNLVASPPRGRGDVIAFWGRRVRRLLPAAFLVLGTTLFLSRYLAPETDWIRTAHEAIASAFYVENWLLVQQATDYLSPDVSPTPVQHYWSLGVEEQFYLVWPLLLLGSAWCANIWWRGRRMHPRTTARIAISLVLVLSFAYSLHATAADPSAAYFMTTTRIWELAAGGLLATWIPPVAMPLTRALGAWIGIAMIGASALLLDSSMAWPGTGAVLPVLGAAGFIWSASGSRLSPGIVLGTQKAQWVGDASYSIYLWHWPLLVLAPLAVGRDLLQVDRIVVVALTLALAWFTLELVENRWRIPNPALPQKRTFQMAGVGAAGVMVIAAAQIVGVQWTDRNVEASAGDLEVTQCYGAAAMEAGPETCPPSETAEVVPSPTRAMDDKAAAFTDGCLVTQQEAPRTCTVGSGSTRVALVGNSHAAHWLPALSEIARTQDLTITTYLVSGCNTIDVTVQLRTAEDTAGCVRWSDAVMRGTVAADYDLIITSQLTAYPVQGLSAADSYAPWVRGYRSSLSSWTSSGTPVLVLRDTPYPKWTIPQVPACVLEHATDVSACEGAREDWLPPDPLADAAGSVAGVQVADLSGYFCTETVCPGVIGGVLAYFDGSHLTTTFMRTMTPFLEPVVVDALSRSSSTVPVAARVD